MKKALSLFLALVMALSVFSISSVAFADGGVVTVSFNGCEANSATKQAIDKLNETRTGMSLPAYTIDDRLTSVARQRAKELFVSYTQTLPNGQTINSYIPEYNEDEYGYLYARIASATPSVYEIYAALADLASLKETVVSIGVGVFSVGYISTIYVLVSTRPAGSVCYNFGDANVLAQVSSLSSNVYYSITPVYDNDYLRINPYVLLTTASGFISSFDVSDQFNIKSSNSKVCKAKNNLLYPKADGSYTITATNKYDASLVVTAYENVSNFNKPKVNKCTAKSSKKKQATIKWSYNISNAEGYEIQYSTNKSFKKGNKTVVSKGNKKFSKTIKGLKSKKYYYVRVRAYVNQGNGEKFYGKYSKTVKVKIK